MLSVLIPARGTLLNSEGAHHGSSVYFSTVDLAFIFPLESPAVVEKQNKKTKQENTAEKSGQLRAPWRAPTNKIKEPESLNFSSDSRPNSQQPSTSQSTMASGKLLRLNSLGKSKSQTDHPIFHNFSCL